MKRQIGIVAMFLLGAAVGSAFPLALAHTEEECVCVCPDPPPCPVVDSEEYRTDAAGHTTCPR